MRGFLLILLLPTLAIAHDSQYHELPPAGLSPAQLVAWHDLHELETRGLPSFGLPVSAMRAFVKTARYRFPDDPIAQRKEFHRMLANKSTAAAE